MGNSIYGKFNQPNLKYLEVKLITEFEEYEKTIQSQSFIKVQFHQNNCLTSQRKRYARRDSLAIIAADVLERSKASLLYKWYYVLKPEFSIKTPLTPQPEICYIDTDCLVYIKAHELDYLRIMRTAIASHYVFSSLLKNHPLYKREREHLIGVLKDEVDGKIISTFHVSSAKCYKATFTDDTSIAKCKGIPKSVSRKYTSEMYRDSALLNNVVQYSTYRRIGVTLQQRQTALIEIRKRTLNGHDTKRVITQGGRDSLPFGHYASYKERYNYQT